MSLPVMMRFLDVFVLFSGSFLSYFVVSGGIVTRFLRRISESQWERYLERRQVQNREELDYGTMREKGLLARLDRMINDSGWREWFGYLCGELYLVFNAALFFLVVLLCRVILGGVILPVLCGILSLGGLFAMLYLSGARRYLKVQKQLMVFINLLENYSKTSDDLVDIISRTGGYLDDPLRDKIFGFQWEAMHGVDVRVALTHLKNQVPHEKFREIIQNLDMCRRHEANYAEVIRDVRISLQAYLRAKQEREEIQKGARGNVAVMLLVGAMILKLTDGFVSGGLKALLFGNTVGLVILCYVMAILLFGVWQFVKVDRT